MAGRVIRLVPKTPYEFNTLGVSGQTTLALAQRVDVSQYTELTLMVRVHALDIPSGVGSIKVQAVPDGHTSEDPGLSFLDTGTVLGSVTIATGSAVPGYTTKALSAGAGPMIAVLLVASQDTSQVTNLDATISVDLCMKV
jgi:hypothetical protein